VTKLLPNRTACVQFLNAADVATLWITRFTGVSEAFKVRGQHARPNRHESIKPLY
jgi:hypothetical protein